MNEQVQGYPEPSDPEQARQAPKNERVVGGMMAEHTPEPWHGSKDGRGVYAYPRGVDRWPIVQFALGGDPGSDGWESRSAANARRIVACVNACAGIPQSSLEGYLVNGGLKKSAEGWNQIHEGDKATIAALRARIAALEKVEAMFVAEGSEIERLRAALGEVAKAEGSFNRDRLTHATNVIEAMVKIAEAALAAGEGAASGRRGLFSRYRNALSSCGHRLGRWIWDDKEDRPLLWRSIAVGFTVAAVVGGLA